MPTAATFANSISQRGAKVYVDPSQNDYADTLAAPYSVRPFNTPTVSTPLDWNEVNQPLGPYVFSIVTILARLKKRGDLFAGVLDKKIATANMKILDSLS